MADFLDVRLAKITREQYISRLRAFFYSLGLEGSLDKQSRVCGTRKAESSVDPEWFKVFHTVQEEERRGGRITESTIRNFYKPVRLFCGVHDIDLSWKKITNIIPTGRKFANDRAPPRNEIQRIIVLVPC